MAREYTLTVETSENTREISEGVTKEMYNATITKVETGQTISIVDVVNTYDRDDWCKTVFEHA